MSNGIEDCLTIGVDFMPDLENGCLVVMRRNGDDIHIINQFRDDEALELYNKLTGQNITRKLDENECKCISCKRIFNDGKIFKLKNNPHKGLCFDCY